jgi:hypothetical protein
LDPDPNVTATADDDVSDVFRLSRPHGDEHVSGPIVRDLDVDPHPARHDLTEFKYTVRRHESFAAP